MPSFDDPGADAGEASEALRGLAHATRTFESPQDLYGVIGALAETVLTRPLTPLEHTAIDAALTEVVRSNDVPAFPWSSITSLLRRLRRTSVSVSPRTDVS